MFWKIYFFLLEVYNTVYTTILYWIIYIYILNLEKSIKKSVYAQRHFTFTFSDHYNFLKICILRNNLPIRDIRILNEKSWKPENSILKSLKVD